jgi:hypothetical protein
MSELPLEELRKHCGHLVTGRLYRNGDKWVWRYEPPTEGDEKRMASEIFDSEEQALKWAEDWWGPVQRRPIGEPKKDEGRMIRPGQWRKSYDAQQQNFGFFVEHWVYELRFLTPEETRPVEEIQARMDQRSLSELESDLNAAFQQLLARAFIVEQVKQPVQLAIPNEEKPLWRLVLIIRGMVDSLSRLAERRPGLVNPIAERQATWPVALSLNPQQMRHATNMLRALGVGSKAPTPTRPGQRVDPNNYFTQLANRAFDACRFDAYLTRELVEHGKNMVSFSGTSKFWSTRYTSTTYVLPDKSWIVLPEPEKTAALSEPVSQENFPRWWEAIKLQVLAYWSKFPEKYGEALRHVGKELKEKEYTRRKDALNAVRQAFRSLTMPTR